MNHSRPRRFDARKGLIVIVTERRRMFINRSRLGHQRILRSVRRDFIHFLLGGARLYVGKLATFHRCFFLRIFHNVLEVFLSIQSDSFNASDEAVVLALTVMNMGR